MKFAILSLRERSKLDLATLHDVSGLGYVSSHFNGSAIHTHPSTDLHIGTKKTKKWPFRRTKVNRTTFSSQEARFQMRAPTPGTNVLGYH
ncbi:hypothetical protein IAD21_04837 [Abditibacteriota bacterium]|nr:hypothetical protein IAD21_04837 [Abditibacteriota bacterium]